MSDFVAGTSGLVGWLEDLDPVLVLLGASCVDREGCLAGSSFGAGQANKLYVNLMLICHIHIITTVMHGFDTLNQMLLMINTYTPDLKLTYYIYIS